MEQQGRGRTSKLTDRRALTDEKSKTPRRGSQAQTAVRCSALVRRRAHNLKNPPAKSLPARRDSRPNHGARNVNRESREIHEKNRGPSSVRILPPTSTQRSDARRAKDRRTSEPRWAEGAGQPATSGQTPQSSPALAPAIWLTLECRQPSALLRVIYIPFLLRHSKIHHSKNFR